MTHIVYLEVLFYTKKLYILEYECLLLHLSMIERFGVPWSIVSLPELRHALRGWQRTVILVRRSALCVDRSISTSSCFASWTCRTYYQLLDKALDRSEI